VKAVSDAVSTCHFKDPVRGWDQTDKQKWCSELLKLLKKWHSILAVYMEERRGLYVQKGMRKYDTIQRIQRGAISISRVIANGDNNVSVDGRERSS